MGKLKVHTDNICEKKMTEKEIYGNAIKTKNTTLKKIRQILETRFMAETIIVVC